MKLQKENKSTTLNQKNNIIINFHEDNIEENMINMQKLKQGEHTVFPAVLCARAEKSGSSRRLQKLTLSDKPV